MNPLRRSKDEALNEHPAIDPTIKLRFRGWIVVLLAAGAWVLLVALAVFIFGLA